MTEALKSASITNLDASPIVANSSGVGAPTITRHVSDFVTVTADGIAASGSTYKIVRVPTNIQLKHVNFFADSALDTGGGSAALTLNVGIYYSDSTTDGTPAALVGTAVGATKICSALSVLGSTEIWSIENVATTGQWSWAKRQEPLWQAAGLSSDPGGNFDIVAAVQTGANTGAAVAFGLEVEFNLPG